LHRVGNQSPEIGAKLRLYDDWIEQLLAVVKQHYDQTNLYVFSDHGMANCETFLDLRSKIDALPVRMGNDYAAVYDSTMARFWFFNDFARRQVLHALSQVTQGRVIPDSELEAMHVLFPDRYFGEVIFLVQEGVLIVPSHMGERPIRGMHGYHPGDKHSYALLCSNLPEIPDDVVAIPDLFRLMISEAMAAKNENSCSLDRFGPGTKLRQIPKTLASDKPLRSQTVLSRSGTSLG
jgi:predicted AlkP superfamily pyrophosphatase or phosphodiesterase